MSRSIAAAAALRRRAPPLSAAFPRTTLSSAELNEINRLIPRLIDSGNLQLSFQLLNAALLADPNPFSLPLQSLSAKCISAADMGPTMALLNSLRRHPRQPSPLPFAESLISGYLSHRKHREAFKVFSWLCRDDSLGRPDAEVYRIVIEGLAKIGRPLEVVKAVREMVCVDGIGIDRSARLVLWRALVMEARIDEARDLDEVLEKAEKEEVRKVIDWIIENWED